MPVTFEQRRQKRCNKRLLENLRQRHACQQRNQPWDKSVIMSRFEHHGEFHGRLFHLYRSFRIGIHGPVNNIGPMDEICQGHRIKTETLLCHHGDEAGTGFEIWIVELPITLILLEMGRVGWSQEGTLMMIEPPGDLE